MNARINLGNIEIDVELKDVKNIHLSVYPPTGAVRIAAPERMSIETIRVFAISKLDWIRKQRTRIRAQEREGNREFLERESHYVWGRRYLLTIVEEDAPPMIALRHRRMHLRVRRGTPPERREAIVEQWYREQLKMAVPPLLERWEPIVGAHAKRFFIQRMKTKWGSCNHGAGTIRLNSELARKPPECLEYIIVHELVHLIEPTHNARFVALMDRHLPNWRHHRDALNRLPVRRERWTY